MLFWFFSFLISKKHTIHIFGLEQQGFSSSSTLIPAKRLFI